MPNKTSPTATAVEPTPRALTIGFDTGGTFTDAVVMTADAKIIATAKALTTHWDLSLGIGEAMAAVLAQCPAGIVGKDIQLVSVSTTLATNAVVENRFSPIATVLIGFDDAMVERARLDGGRGGHLIRLSGGHDATGVALAPLDLATLEREVIKINPTVEAYAVAGTFSVRNSAHELAVKEWIRAHTHKTVTCAHELSSKLDAPRRALTVALNARLTPQIRQLVVALQAVLAKHTITAPLMLVKGDGSLMRAEMALEYPIETVLSGPAASVVGATFLTGLEHFMVADMGGTTTDVALVEQQRPRISQDGALIGGWRTLVEAVDVHTTGLGGDSEVRIDRHGELCVGPRKTMSLSLLATRFPDIIDQLKLRLTQDFIPERAGQMAFLNSERALGSHASAIERRVFEQLRPTPRFVADMASGKAALEALWRLADSGLATIAAFTPSDAAHVLQTQTGWNREAACLAAELLTIEQRNTKALRTGLSVEALAALTIDKVIVGSARIIMETALAADPGLSPQQGRFGVLGDALLSCVYQGKTFSNIVSTPLGLNLPIVAIGAPVGVYYPTVAHRLNTTLVIPPHAEVCNAVGAVAGMVQKTIRVVVNQAAFKLFKVHTAQGVTEFESDAEALAFAQAQAKTLAFDAAIAAGALNPDVTLALTEQRAKHADQPDYLAEATVIATARGRPRLS
jgi:N-methylhydantoinase A/oxoprolinase/acetone carboxylase beta subunit